MSYAARGQCLPDVVSAAWAFCATDFGLPASTVRVCDSVTDAGGGAASITFRTCTVGSTCPVGVVSAPVTVPFLECDPWTFRPGGRGSGFEVSASDAEVLAGAVWAVIAFGVAARLMRRAL